MKIGTPYCIAAIAFLSACTASGPTFTRAPDPPPGQALVYVYRPLRGTAALRDTYFSIDGVALASISQGGYTWVHVKAGAHKIKQRWSLLDVPYLPADGMQWAREWKEGQTYFYRFTPEYIGNRTFKYTLTEVPESTALSEIGQTQYQSAQNAENFRVLESR